MHTLFCGNSFALHKDFLFPSATFVLNLIVSGLPTLCLWELKNWSLISHLNFINTILRLQKHPDMYQNNSNNIFLLIPPVKHYVYSINLYKVGRSDRMRIKTKNCNVPILLWLRICSIFACLLTSIIKFTYLKFQHMSSLKNSWFKWKSHMLLDWWTRVNLVSLVASEALENDWKWCQIIANVLFVN